MAFVQLISFSRRTNITYGAFSYLLTPMLIMQSEDSAQARGIAGELDIPLAGDCLTC